MTFHDNLPGNTSLLASTHCTGVSLHTSLGCEKQQSLPTSPPPAPRPHSGTLSVAGGLQPSLPHPTSTQRPPSPYGGTSPPPTHVCTVATFSMWRTSPPPPPHIHTAATFSVGGLQPLTHAHHVHTVATLSMWRTSGFPWFKFLQGVLLYKGILKFLYLCVCVCADEETESTLSVLSVLQPFKKVLFVFIYVRVCACVNRCVPCTCRSQKRVLDSLELESQMAVSCLVWMLGTKLRSSVGAVHALNYVAISPAFVPGSVTAFPAPLSPHSTRVTGMCGCARL